VIPDGYHAGVDRLAKIARFGPNADITSRTDVAKAKAAATLRASAQMLCLRAPVIPRQLGGTEMGALFFFDEKIIYDRAGARRCQVEVLDNHGVPELRIGPEGEAYKGCSAYFTDRGQFHRFADAVEELRRRVAPMTEEN
jgi:hypothetical protein